jgi:hypothetical protein
VRPIPWLIRLALFAVGFGVGVSHNKHTPPQQPVIIEVQILLEDSKNTIPVRNTVPGVSFPVQSVNF